MPCAGSEYINIFFGNKYTFCGFATLHGKRASGGTGE